MTRRSLLLICLVVGSTVQISRGEDAAWRNENDDNSNSPLVDLSHLRGTASIECSLEQEFTQFIPTQSKTVVSVRECWCAQLIMMEEDSSNSAMPRFYCPAHFETCRILRKRSKANDENIAAIQHHCFSTSKQMTIARGVWPFVLFWVSMLIYLLVASEPGRRTRNYAKRKMATLFHRGPNDDEEIEQEVDPVESTVGHVGTEQQDDSEESFPPETAEAEVEGINSASSPSSVEQQLQYPTEFGSRLNFTLLLRDYQHIREYEPDGMARLWYHAVRSQERRLGRARRRRGQDGSERQLPEQQQQQQQYDESLLRDLWRHRPWAARGMRIPPVSENQRIQLALRTRRFEGPTMGGIHDHDQRQATDLGNDENDENAEFQCAICLLELEEGEEIGDISCHHAFHKDCLKTWLCRSNRCPLCQQEGIAKVSFIQPDEEGERDMDAPRVEQ